MKKTIISYLTLWLIGTSVNAQEFKGKFPKIYLRAGGGYSFPHAAQEQAGNRYLSGSVTYNPQYTGQNISTFAESFDLKKVSFGSGLNGVVSVGALFTKNIGIEVAASVGIGSRKYKYNYVLNEESISPTYTYRLSLDGTIYQQLPIWIMPAVVVQTGGEKVNIYSRIGMVLPISGKIIDERKFSEKRSDRPSSAGQEEHLEITTRFALGIQGALGIQLKLSDKVAFYIEANGVSMNAYAKSSNMTHLTVNGRNYLGNISTSQKQKEFDLNYTVTAPKDNEPSRAPSYSIPMSNIGLGMGLTIIL